MNLDPQGRRTRRRVRALALVVSTLAATCSVILPAASSSGLTLIPGCPSVAMSQTFARWADPNYYFLVVDGGFESGGTGWSRSGGAGAARGNEPWRVNRATDSHSLAMPNGAKVVSPTECVTMGENTVRLFVRDPGDANAVLHVQAYVQNPLTGLVLSTGFDLHGTPGHAGWAPSAPLLIPNLLGGVLGTQRLTLVFSARSGSAANWGIDDVYVDPFKSR